MSLKHILPKRPPILDTMLSLTEQLNTTTTNRRNYSRLLQSFARSIVTFATSTKPESIEKFSILQSHYNGIADLHDNMADAESRTSEDIRDLVERYVVVARATEEYNAQKELYQADSNTLLERMADDMVASKQPGYEKVKTSLQNRVAHAKLQKKFNGQILIEKVKALIVVRQKYNAFKLRRFEHGWRVYAQAKAELAQRQKTAVLEIMNLLKEEELPIEKGAQTTAAPEPGQSSSTDPAVSME